MRTENNPRPSRLLRVREFTEKAGSRSNKPSKKANGKSRFVAPYYFSGEDQADIQQTLSALGIGDPEGIQLFITAAEYEVGSLRPALLEESAARQPAPQPKCQSKADVELVQLGQSAARLHALLQSTHKTARKRLLEALTASDPFAREHGPGYLSQLELELERIAQTCSQAEVPEEQAESLAAPQNPQAQKLILQIARIYRECLDTAPDGDADGPFCHILCIIRDSAGIDIPCDAESVGQLLV